MTNSVAESARIVMLMGALLTGCGNQGAPGAQAAERPDAASTESRADSAQAVLESARTIARADPELAKRLAPTAGGWSAHQDGIVSLGWEPRPGKKASELAARAPERADGKWELTLDRTEHYRLAMQWEDAASVAAEPVDGAVVYRNVHDQTDAIVTSTESYVEVSYVLRGESAPRKWTWQFDGGPGISGARSAPDGGIYLLRNDGEPVWNVPAAFAVDAAGKRIGVRSQWVDRRIKFEMEGEPKQYPVVVDPIVTALFWVERKPATSPSARQFHGMAYDSQRGRTVLFGGHDGFTSVADTWEWDGTNWALRTPATSPPAMTGPSMAYDVQRRRTVLYYNQTWEWDGTNWVLFAPTQTPSGGGWMVYDSQRGRSVLFGAGSAGQTWEWDGISWVLRTPTTSPLARDHPAMAYDSQRGRTVLFGGERGSTALADTWEWDGTTWTVLTPTTRAPTSLKSPSCRELAVSGLEVLDGGRAA